MTRILVALAFVGACAKDETSNKPAASTTPVVAKEPTVEKPPKPRPAQLTQVTIKALGMYCEESCPVKVRTALAEVPAVYELGFDLSKESVFVSYDATLGPAKQVTKPMIAAIKSAGFDPWLAKESWPDDGSVKVTVVAR